MARQARAALLKPSSTTTFTARRRLDGLTIFLRLPLSRFGSAPPGPPPASLSGCSPRPRPASAASHPLAFRHNDASTRIGVFLNVVLGTHRPHRSSRLNFPQYPNNLLLTESTLLHAVLLLF